MPVIARGNAWQATLHHKGQRWRRDFVTKAEADVWHAEGHASILRGEAPVMPSRGSGGEDTPSTLQALLDRTAARYWKDAKAGPVLEANGQAVVDLLGRHLRPDQVTTGRVDALVEALRRKGNSNGTINRKLAALSRMMTFAVDRGYIARKPKLERLREAEGRLRWISDAEEAALLAYLLHIGDEDMHDYCMVALDTGMRAG
ncbi:hypothetical protein UFOVP347_52, partial [uncultured Caudovirales phage]